MDITAYITAHPVNAIGGLFLALFGLLCILSAQQDKKFYRTSDLNIVGMGILLIAAGIVSYPLIP